MLRHYQSLLSKLYLVLDAVTVVVALVIAWVIRFKAPFLPHYPGYTFGIYMSILPEALAVFLLSESILGMYGTTRTSRMSSIALAQGKSVIAMLLVIMSILYFTKQVHYSLLVLLLFIVGTWIFGMAGRVIVRLVMRIARKNGFNRKYILLVGMTKATHRFLHHVSMHQDMGYHVLGYLTSQRADELQPPQDVACLGSIAQLDDVLREHIIDHLFFTLPSDDSQLILSLMEVAESHGVHAMLVPNFLDILPSRPKFDEFAGLPIVDTRYIPLDDALNTMIKRLFDIVFSILVLTIGSPLLLILALLVRLSSSGPILYKQQRLGRNRRTFTMYKFRTMYPSQDEDHPGWTVPQDPRCTTIGQFLRSTSLDELPQFFNVLRGDMSVIGPRPEQPYYVEQFREDVPRYMIKHRVRPGITGWAQVNGLRGDTSISDRIEYDLRYIENWSLTWDLRIVGLTIWKGFRHKNAY